ncbi:hypothetical protein DQ04_00251050 [Trypanosoma grayi]|uniref:hypothetical protein n=1 Tax=Trypanosoma grayi TaxID=71804 RepID=UPI0004F4022F|nr:hypothetical protein DQ04_00251050 [Trypanosoma grayi]KEG14929.1 hypothetical protein DQ04_00251050 [Trypanosoma grayi]
MYYEVYDIQLAIGIAMLLFQRPHVSACEGHAEISVELDPLRQLPSYADFEQLLRRELEDVYGAAPAEFRGGITYSTHEAPHSFSAHFSEHQLETLRKYDASVEKAAQLRRDYEAAADEHERALEEDKDRRKTQRKLREEAKVQKRLKMMKRGVVDAECEVAALSQKLRNVFAIDSIRVPLE